MILDTNNQCGTSLQLKMFKKTMWREWEDKSHTISKYLQKTYLINEDYPKYTKKNINNKNQAIWLKSGPTPKTLKKLTKGKTEMENKHKKICGTLYVIREMWIETTLWPLIYLLEWTESRTLTMPNSDEDV